MNDVFSAILLQARTGDHIGAAQRYFAAMGTQEIEVDVDGKKYRLSPLTYGKCKDIAIDIHKRTNWTRKDIKEDE